MVRHIAASCVKYRKGRSVIGPVRVELTHGVKRPAMHYGAHGVFPKSPAYPTNGHSALDLMEDALDGIVAGGLISSKQSFVDLQSETSLRLLAVGWPLTAVRYRLLVAL